MRLESYSKLRAEALTTGFGNVELVVGLEIKLCSRIME